MVVNNPYRSSETPLPSLSLCTPKRSNNPYISCFGVHIPANLFSLRNILIACVVVLVALSYLFHIFHVSSTESLLETHEKSVSRLRGDRKSVLQSIRRMENKLDREDKLGKVIKDDDFARRKNTRHTSPPSKIHVDLSQDKKDKSKLRYSIDTPIPILSPTLPPTPLPTLSPTPPPTTSPTLTPTIHPTLSPTPLPTLPPTPLPTHTPTLLPTIPPQASTPPVGSSLASTDKLNISSNTSTHPLSSSSSSFVPPPLHLPPHLHSLSSSNVTSSSNTTTTTIPVLALPPSLLDHTSPLSHPHSQGHNLSHSSISLSPKRHIISSSSSRLHHRAPSLSNSSLFDSNHHPHQEREQTPPVFPLTPPVSPNESLPIVSTPRKSPYDLPKALPPRTPPATLPPSNSTGGQFDFCLDAPPQGVVVSTSSLPVDQFDPLLYPLFTTGEMQRKWREAVRGMRGRVQREVLGGNPLREKMREEVEGLRKIRREVFCS